MPYPKPFAFTRTSVDPIMEEVIAVLSDREAVDFKTLFGRVLESLKSKNARSGTEEVMRLRCYDRLLTLTASGLVEKKEKTFRGLAGIENASSLKARGTRAKGAGVDS